MLGLLLDEPLEVDPDDEVIDRAALARLERHGLLARAVADGGGETLALTPRGRLLGGGVTVELLTLE
jgi:hypothetical protein